MKWMWSTAVVVVAVSAVVGAQSRKDNESRMGDNMNMTYTGCVVAVNHGEAFLLTHIAAHPAMHHDAAMKSDSGMAAKDEPPASNEMHNEHTMMSSAVVLTGRSDLKKFVGQKVTVTGSVAHGTSETMPDNRATLTVTSLKSIAKSCS